jgi:AAA domain-containing protein
MPFNVESAEDVSAIEKRALTVAQPELPKVLNVADILALDVPEAAMLIEGMIPAAGASLIVGAAKSGKTLAAVQMAIAVASGEALYGHYRVLSPGPSLIVEQDDPAGAGSVKTILQRSSVDVTKIPFHFVGPVPYSFGVEFLLWLEAEIIRLGVRFAALDSYTALRGSRPKGVDIVKAEQSDLTQMDALAKRTNCALSIIHHSSKGSAGLDWSEKAAGTFAMSAATESQMFISRFPELDGAATERLVRIRGRHSEDLEMVLRFQKETLNFEHVLEGGAATMYPALLQLRTTFGTQPFSPKELTHATGVSRATACRLTDRLYRANAIQKKGYGEYVLTAGVQ